MPKPPPRHSLIQTGTRALIYIAFFLTGLIDFEVVPAPAAWITELIIVVMLLDVMRQCGQAHKSLVWVGLPYVFIVLACCLLSTFFHRTSPIALLLYLRLLFRFYILMIVLLNSDINLRDLKRLNSLMAWLYILQIPVAAARIPLYGQGEKAVGTYAFHEGGNSTIIPMLAMSFLVPFHYLYKRSPRTYLLGLGFLAFGVIGGKRGIIILVPIALLFSAACLRWTLGRKLFGRVGMIIVMLTLLGGSASFYTVSRLVPRLNPDEQVWGRFSPSFAYDRLKERLATKEKGKTAGQRVSASIRAWKHLASGGPATLLLGDGPGYYMKSIFNPAKDYKRRLEKVGIVYGLTGLNWMYLQMGIIGAATWMLFFMAMFRTLKRYAREETDPYWKAYMVSMMGATFVVIVICSIYNLNLLTGDLSAFAYMTLLGIAFRRRMIVAEETRQQVELVPATPESAA
ncbi:MAG: hypothetical protein O3A51_00870 [Verrucomicrobia bacterium]|nr:hypothetical protein [Verrucomicrobiota bacterium]